MSLTSCLKKAGTALRAQDKAAILDLSRKYRSEGMTPDAAAIKAIDAQLAAVGKAIDKEQAAYEKLLKAPSKAEVLAQQEQATKVAKEEKANRRTEAEKAQQDDDRKRIAKASEAAADSFELGGDAMDNLTGQKDIFGTPDLTTSTKEFGSKIPANEISTAQRSIDGFKAGDIVNVDGRTINGWTVKEVFMDESPLGKSDPWVGMATVVSPAGKEFKVLSADLRKSESKQDPVKIEDIGEKIGGARKDRWKDRGLDLTDLDAMSEAEGAELATKANVWKPDYEAMAEATEPVTAAMVKTVYDQLAAQPKKNTPEGRRNYVTMMQAVRKAYSEAKSPEDVKQAGDKLKRAIGLYTDNPEQKKQAREVLFSVYKGRSDPFVLGYNELSKSKKMVEDGFPAKGEPWKKRLTVRAYSGTGLTPRGIEITLNESAELGTPLTREHVAAGFYRINAKDGKAVGYAPTKADVEATAKTIYKRDLKKGAAEKPEPTRPNLDSMKREGLPKRTDRDVSADDFVKDFGFRGVEFGNWAAQDERQRIINMAYDGLMDLAEIMGVPPKALSLNGTMGMAFGARGGGKFAAHYEPGKLVINMTKINGGGSMAHEWAHALDHYFGELNQKDAYTTKARGASGWYDEQQYKGVPMTRMEKDAQGKWANVTKMRLDNMRPEMAKAFDGVMSALFSGQETKAQMVRSEELAIERYQALADKENDPEMKGTYLNGIKSRQQALEELRKDPDDKMYPKGRSSYASQAQALSGKSTTGYWLRPTEMFARAFESWVFDKVAAMGARSDYLVHGVEEDRFAGGGYKGNPYPTGQERATINAAFDKLASTIKTKETDKGVAMFARGAPQTEAFQKWFGDSKVVDADGKPLVVYHGTTKDFGEFAPGTGYFTADPFEANMYGGFNDAGANVMPAYLSIKKPRVIESETMTGTPRDVIADALTDGDIDGVIVTEGGKVRWAVVTEPTQIKSATGNNGEYDPANPDIRYALGADAFRLGITPRKFMPVSDVQKAVDQLTAKWKDGPRVKVVLSPQELPMDAPSDARGLIHNGTAYIVAGNHTDRAGVARTLGHEAIGHYGLWKMLAEESKNEGKNLQAQFERNLQLAIKSGNKPLNAIAARVRELYVDDSGKFNLSSKDLANEIAAFVVEDAIDPKTGEFKPGFGFVKSVYAKVADFLRSLGFDIKFTNAELQGMLVSAMRGLEAGHRLDGGMEGLVAAARSNGQENMIAPVSRNPAKTPLYEAMRQLSRFEDAFHTNTSTAKDLTDIAKGVVKVDGDNARKFKAEPSTALHQGNRKPTLALKVTLPNGNEVKLLDIFDADKDRPFVVIGNSEAGQDVGGATAYQIAFAWAHSNGKTMRPDPAGLTVINRLRRTEAMISSAMHFGTTKHLEPHQDQYVALLDRMRNGGTEPEDTHYSSRPDIHGELEALKDKLWTKGSDATTIATNVQHLLQASTQLAYSREPAIRNIEVADGVLRVREGRDGALSLSNSALADASGASEILGVVLRPATSGVGGSTLRRAAVTGSVARRIANISQSGSLLSEGKNTGDQRPDVAALQAIREVLGQPDLSASDGLKGVFYARGAQQDAFAPTVWNTPDPTTTDKIIYELQDGRVDLKRVQQAIEKSGQQIAEKWDARLAETLYPGRVAYRSQQFLETDVKPLLKAMATYGVPMDELADYLHARGAEERNAQVAKVNDDLPDGGAGKNSKGVLLTNQAARDYLADVSQARKKVLDVLAAKVDAITADTRTLLVTEGLEKQDTIDAWTKTYKNYVPMFRDEAQSGAPHPQGSGFSVKGSASKRATGSTKEVTNILAHVLMQREAAITRAEKNRVALSLYGQALSHPNPEFWTTIKPSMTSASIGAELQRMGVDPMTAAAGMEMVPTITTVDAATGKKVDRPNPLYRSLPGAIPLKVNGEDRVLMLNTEHERGARLAENLKNLDGLTKLDLASSIVGKSTRWLASVNTQYNPAFGLVNLTRDTLGGAINLGSTELRGNALKVLSQTPAAILGIARELASGGQTGKWQALYRQFQADGGQTGYKENFRDAGDRAKAIEKELAGIERSKLHPGRAAHAILDLLDGFNTTLENAVRLSAYKAGLDKGMTGAQAARLGRELTVDFNRKGRAGREVGPLYAFFNASVQGTARTMEAIKGPTGKKIIAGGLGLGVLQALMLAAAGYDDDEVPEFVKTRALVIPLNWTGEGEKTHVLVPYPLGLHVIPNTGRVLTELVLNGGKNIGKRTGEAVSEIAAAFNPMGGGNIFTADGALKTVAPTVVDPIIEFGFNRNFAGNSIEREAFKGETDTRPGVARAKDATQRTTTGQAYMGISKAINAMTGGNEYEAGKFSPSPEMVRYVAQTVGGGVLREIEKTINASTAASHGEKVKMSQIPVAGRFYGEVDADQVKTSRYFENAKHLDKLENTQKTIIKAGDAEAMAKLLEKNPDMALISLGNKVQSSVAKLNKMAIQTIDDRESLKQIDETRVQIMDQLNQAVESLEKEKPPTPAAKIKGWRKEPVTP